MQKKKKSRYVFTFGGNHPFEGRCQPIYASSDSEARDLMCAVYGTNWAFQYTEEQWLAIQYDSTRHWPMETPLEPIISGRD